MVAVYRILLACLALVVLLASAASAEAACRVTDASPRYSKELSRGVLRVCDHRSGRRREVARGVADVAAAGPRVAFASVRRARATIGVLDQRTGRVVRRIDGGPVRPGPLTVALTTKGDVAFLVRRSTKRFVLGAVAASGARLGTRSGVVLTDLVIEDDTTVRYREQGSLRWFDLRRPLVRDGCPVRSGFSPVFDTGDMLVTARRYPGSITTTVTRACLRSTGRDPVVAIDEEEESYYFFRRALAARAGWVVVRTANGTKYGCEYGGLIVAHADGRAERELRIPCQPSPPEDVLPPLADPGAVTVTETGTPAWIRDGRVLALSADNRIVELDRGDVAALGVDGPRITWTNAGEPRTATP